MSSIVLAIFLVFGSIPGLVAFEIDKLIYCNLSRCGEENVVCRKVNYSSPCRPRARLVSLSDEQRNVILNTVNQFRNTAAAGLTHKLLPAGRMARIQWSPELEHFAMMDAMSCVSMTRPCMTSPNFPNMGSIFDMYSYLGKRQNSLKIITEMISQWTSEGRYVTSKQTAFLSENSDLKFILRVALLMSERNTHMGCSAVKLQHQRFRYLYLSCTFATMNILGLPIYRSAKSPAQMCLKRDVLFTNLCAAGEKYLENAKLVDLRMHAK
ncbi:tabinhibitin 7-like [Drosophila kikkawai]|uniref:Tabinhibitin 7-like n=1 Tax=Drosophila kikkawai TaxID=30033 RepID=A0A6P4J532_DROKI|nr:allergen Tab y 5.0101-like [Drosophila kikkawai]